MQFGYDKTFHYINNIDTRKPMQSTKYSCILYSYYWLKFYAIFIMINQRFRQVADRYMP